MSRFALSRNDCAMLSAIGRISSGSVSGTAFTHGISSASVMADALPRSMPASVVSRTFADRRVPPQSGQGTWVRNFSTRFMPFSSLTRASAFSTV